MTEQRLSDEFHYSGWEGRIRSKLGVLLGDARRVQCGIHNTRKYRLDQYTVFTEGTHIYVHKIGDNGEQEEVEQEEEMEEMDADDEEMDEDEDEDMEVEDMEAEDKEQHEEVDENYYCEATLVLDYDFAPLTPSPSPEHIVEWGQQ